MLVGSTCQLTYLLHTTILWDLLWHFLVPWLSCVLVNRIWLIHSVPNKWFWSQQCTPPFSALDIISELVYLFIFTNLSLFFGILSQELSISLSFCNTWFLFQSLNTSKHQCSLHELMWVWVLHLFLILATESGALTLNYFSCFI